MEHEIERRTNERLQYSLKSQSHQLQSQSHQLQSQLTQSSMLGSPNVIHNMEGALAELSLDYTNRTRKQIRSNKLMNE